MKQGTCSKYPFNATSLDFKSLSVTCISNPQPIFAFWNYFTKLYGALCLSKHFRSFALCYSTQSFRKNLGTVLEKWLLNIYSPLQPTSLQTDSQGALALDRQLLHLSHPLICYNVLILYFCLKKFKKLCVLIHKQCDSFGFFKHFLLQTELNHLSSAVNRDF